MSEGSPTAFPRITSQNTVCVVDGHGARVYVNRGHLIVEDGAGRQRRTRRFHKATAGITRVVMLARSGFISIDAIRWLTEARIGFVHLDPDGRLLLSSAPPVGHDPRLRRAQARAVDAEIGVEITRRILTAKIEGQARVVAGVDVGAAGEVASALTGLDSAMNLDELRLIEASAAATYWAAFATLPVHFVKADADRIPDHWMRIGVRRSPITGNQRLASNPAHAIVNYLYALLEAEARISCATAGLDPAIGILHADQPYRDSLAHDVMEAARPDVDQYVIDLLTGHHFRRRDFYETRRGSCRINRRLTHALAGTTPTWSQAVAPTVESVTKMLAGKRKSWQQTTPTRLTQANRSAGRTSQRDQAAARRRAALKPTSVCAECGIEIPAAQRTCGSCRVQAETVAAHRTATPPRQAKPRRTWDL